MRTLTFTIKLFKSLPSMLKVLCIRSSHADYSDMDIVGHPESWPEPQDSPRGSRQELQFHVNLALCPCADQRKSCFLSVVFYQLFSLIDGEDC